ncbi:MAG: hypothetical protein AB1646_04275 [Thermodesulfobacteriota bacterium]
MAFTIQAEPGETILIHEVYVPPENAGIDDDQHRFAFAVSDRALYVPHRKWYAWGDAWSFRRIPLSRVKSVTLHTSPPGWGWRLLNVSLAAVGLLSTWSMITSILAGFGQEIDVNSIFLPAVGLLLLFVYRGRSVLLVSF